ncbi:Glutamate--tRNA ligase, mitochondrial [Pseudozyma hubeiensis]|nr:Glutamate--tRNA ligase, mitochondrial [Pseudozyma hubeiensis]
MSVSARSCRRCVRDLAPPLRRRLHSTTTTASTSTASTSSTTSPPRLRFAPSPTGYLHLGGLRTALFNHLFARSLGGKWILRIEDTDQTRLVPGSVVALQDTLAWANLDYDEGPSAGGKYGPYIQSERLDLYRHYAEKLISEGKAYRDFRAEVVASTDPHNRTKQVPLRDTYIAPDESEAKHLISLNKPYVVRLRAPTTSLDHTDLVYGSIHFPSDPLRHGTEDPILLKSNLWPTYHLASVVDDHLMGITHVLRGEEWLPSLPKHLWLYKALGFQVPEFAHLPLLINADGSKLSKRSGDVRVESYREKGVEAEALCNFVGLMGYNNLRYHEGKRREEEVDGAGLDVLTMDEMVKGFRIEDVNRSRASVDLSKLYYLNARHLGLKLGEVEGRKEVVGRIRGRLEEAFPEARERFEDDEEVAKVVELTRGTCATLFDVPQSATPLFRRPTWAPHPPPDTLSLFRQSKLIHTHFPTALSTAHQEFSALQNWTHDSIHAVIASLPRLLSTASIPQGESKAPPTKIKKAAILAPLRFAISANERGAPLADLLLFLGRDESLHRLRAALDAVEVGSLTVE